MMSLQQEVERRLTENMNELQTQKADLAEAQACIMELQEWKIEAGELMMEMWDQTKQMQESH